MNEKEEVLNQIRKVIVLLKERLDNDPDRPILIALYSRYLKAEEILKNNEEIDKVMINGGCRAYLDAFNDYMNPLLIDMDKAEKMISEMKKEK